MAGGLALAEEDADGLAPEESDDLTALLQACLVALRLPSHGEIHQPQRLPFWSVSDAARRISQLLPQRPAGGASLEEFLPDVVGQRAALAATLVAGLELVRDGDIALQQAETWGSIIMIGS